MKADRHVLSTYLGIARQTPEEAVLRLLVELGIDYVGADEGSLLVVDRDSNELVFAMTAGGAESEKALVGQRVPLGKGLTGLAAATGQVQIGAPTFKDIRQRKRAAGQGGHPSAVLAAPMLINDEVIGVITAASFDVKKRFTQRDAALCAKIASVAAVVVEQHRRLRALEELHRGKAAIKPISENERRRSEIIDAVARLTRRYPARLADVLSLLKAIDAVCARGPA